MTDESKQLVFEAHLSDLEMLVRLSPCASSYSWSIPGAFGKIIQAKAETLFENAVHVSESKTVRDLERLVKIRSDKTFCVGQTRTREGHAAIIDSIIKWKIAALAKSSPEELDLDAVDGLQRLATIRENIIGDAVRFIGKIEDCLRLRVALLRDQMALPKIIPENGISGSSISSVGHSTSKAQDIAPNDQDQTGAETGGLQVGCAKWKADTAHACRHEHDLLKVLTERVLMLEDDKASLAVQFQKANDTLSQILERVGRIELDCCSRL